MLLQCSLKEFNKWWISLPGKAFRTSLSSFPTKRERRTVKIFQHHGLSIRRSSQGNTGPARSPLRRLRSPRAAHDKRRQAQHACPETAPPCGEPRRNPLWKPLAHLFPCAVYYTGATWAPVCSKSTNIPISRVCQIMKFPEYVNCTVLTSTGRPHSLVTRCHVRRLHHHERQIQTAPKWIRSICRATLVSLLS